MEAGHKSNDLKKFTHKRKHSYIPLSASIIASVLLAMNPNYKVLAEDNEESEDLLKIKALHEDYHSLLNNATASETEVQEENEEDLEAEAVETSDSEEIQMIKNNLLLAIEKVGSPEYAGQLQATDLTVDELDQIFESLIADLLAKEEAEEKVNAAEDDSAEEDFEDSAAEEETDLEDSAEEEIEEVEEENFEENSDSEEDFEDSEEADFEDSVTEEETEEDLEDSFDVEETCL